MNESKLFVAGLVEKEGKYLLIEQNKNDSFGSWVIPCGKMEPKESLVEALKDRVKHQTGISVEPESLVGIYQKTKTLERNNIVLFLFKAKIIGDNSNNESQSSTKYLSYKEILELNKQKKLRSIFLVEALKDCEKSKSFEISILKTLKGFGPE